MNLTGLPSGQRLTWPALVLDVLGPWPVYVVAEMVIVMVGWALITLPWTGLVRRGGLKR